MRKFFVAYSVNKEPKNDSIALYEKECENAKEGNLAYMILKEIEELERSGYYKKDIVLLNFWEIYDKT